MRKVVEMSRAMRSLLSLSLCWLITFSTATAQEAPKKKPSFDSDGVAIQYLVAGRDDGEAVVLIHGFGDKKEEWAPMIEALKKDFKVIALDCRGHGGSGKPHDPQKYGVEMVNDVRRLLDHLKIEKAHVVGYSMGAGIALSFAIRHPERLRTLTLGGNGAPDAALRKMLPELADSLEKSDIEPILRILIPKDQPVPSPEKMKLINVAFFATQDAKALAAVTRGAANLFPSEQQVEAVRVPVLAVVGEVDPLRTGVDKLKKLLPKTKVVVIEKADHMSAFSSPQFPKEVRQFLDDNRSPAKK